MKHTKNDTFRVVHTCLSNNGQEYNMHWDILAGSYEQAVCWSFEQEMRNRKLGIETVKTKIFSSPDTKRIRVREQRATERFIQAQEAV